MLQELLPLLPASPSQGMLAAAVVGATAGAVLWIAGARFSRSLLTLIAVAGGTFAGMRLPNWCGWGIDPMATGIAGAIVMGVCAYAMPRLSVGLALGAVLALWGAAATWVLCGDANWTWPATAAGQSLPAHLADAWKSLPPNVIKYLPAAAGLALMSGFACGLLWPKVSAILAWTLGGLTMLVATGLVLVQHATPQFLRSLPARNATQAAVLAVMVAAGALLQWRLFPVAPEAPPDAKDED